jgi:hypothetical protein
LCRCSSKLNSAEQWVFAFWVVRQGILADNVAKGRREGVACFFHFRKKVYTEETKPNSTNYHNIERQLSKKSNHPNLWKYSPNTKCIQPYSIKEKRYKFHVKSINNL